MTDNYSVYGTRKKHMSKWVYFLILFVSFIWVSAYPAVSSVISTFHFGYGNLMNLKSTAFGAIVSLTLFDALFYFLAFELIFYFYRYILAFKVYSFIVPMEDLRAKSHIFFVYRNIIYGVFVNLCFIFPYLHAYIECINLIVTLIVMLVFVKHLVKTYSEPVISHFVFKNFCYPIFVYEALVVIFAVLEVI